MATSEAHGDSTQYAIHLIKMGRLPCACHAHCFSIGFIDHAPYHPFIRSRRALGVGVLVMNN